MPTNLPPQYFEAEKRYREARSVPEKVAALNEMLAIMPKHKGTDHLKADLRARIARHLDDLDKPSRLSGRTSPFTIRKEGAGQAVLVGLPNAGKSQLLRTLTGVETKVGDYPFTTQEPRVGMLAFENVLIQLIDVPALTERRVEGPLYGLLRNADLLVPVVDLNEGGLDQAQKVFDALERWGFRLLARGESPDPQRRALEKPALWIANKADIPGAMTSYRGLRSELAGSFTLLLISARDGTGLGDVGRQIFDALQIVRIYTKAPGRDAEMTRPLVLPRGSSVMDAALSLHREWRDRLKYAVLWGSGKFAGQKVGRDYVLADGDILELQG